MSDELDFEELDAAVNDLLANDKDDDAARGDRAEIVQAEHAEVVENIPAAPKNAAITEKPTAQSARRFRGQFMDMVHPSSDVHVTDKPNHAAERATKIEETTEVEAENPAPADEALAEVFTANDEPVEEPQLEVEADETPHEDEPTEPIETVELAEAEASEQAYESPFLADAKVEKRPLGAMPPTSLLAADDSGAGELEPELNESNFITAFIEEMKETAAAAAEEKPEKKSAETTAVKPAPIAAPEADHLPRRNVVAAPPQDTRAALANTMIMPQYKTSETAQLAEAGSPYAAGAAEPAPAAKAKHFPVWGWILIYLLLAAAGAALGAWVYLGGLLK